MAILGLLITMLHVVLGVAQLVCWIVVLVKLIQKNELVLGILGIFCGLIAFIGGWMHADKLNIRKVMLIWSCLIIAQILLSALFFVLAMVTAQ